MSTFRELYIDKTSRNSVLLYIVMLLPFFKPGSLAELNLSLVEIIYAVAEVVITLTVAISIIKNKEMNRDPFLLAVLMLTLIVLVSTVLNGQSIRNWLGQWAPRFAVVLISCWAMRKNPAEYLASVLSIMSVYCITNLITVIAFPDGMYQTPSTFPGDNYFLGHRNGAGLYILLMLVSSLILENNRKEFPLVGRRTWILYSVGVLQTLMAFCATTLIALIFFGVGLCVMRSTRIRGLLNPLAASVIGVLCNIGVVFFRIQTLFAPLIEDVLHRDISLSSRTEIWDQVLTLISGLNILLGRGVDGHESIVIGETVISSAHNEPLDIMLQAGIFGSIAYITFIGSFVYRVFVARDCAISMIASIFLFTVLVMGITYVTTSTMTYLAIALMFYSITKRNE